MSIRDAYRWTEKCLCERVYEGGKEVILIFLVQIQNISETGIVFSCIT